MPDATCPHCRQKIQTPEDVAEARCVHCGQVLPVQETHITASGPASSSAIQPVEEAEWSPPHSQHNPEALPEKYSSWAEFRELAPSIQGELIKLATQPLPDMRGAELRSLPADLPAGADDFGRPLATLVIPGEKRALNWTAGAVIALSGCAFLVVGGFSIYSLVMLVGLIGVALGAWYAFFRRPSLEITLWIFENGLFLQRGNESEACAWEDIQDFKSDPNSGRPTYAITTQRDCRLILSSEQTPAIMPLAEYVNVKIASAQLLPKLRRVFEGERIKFGLLSLDRAGVTGRFTARWPEIVRIMADDANVYIDCRNRKSWHQIRCREISFLRLLLAISHVMIEEGKRLPPADV